jgi:hypothetical protein
VLNRVSNSSSQIGSFEQTRWLSPMRSRFVHHMRFDDGECFPDVVGPIHAASVNEDIRTGNWVFDFKLTSRSDQPTHAHFTGSTSQGLTSERTQERTKGGAVRLGHAPRLPSSALPRLSWCSSALSTHEFRLSGARLCRLSRIQWRFPS